MKRGRRIQRRTRQTELLAQQHQRHELVAQPKHRNVVIPLETGLAHAWHLLNQFEETDLGNGEPL